MASVTNPSPPIDPENRGITSETTTQKRAHARVEDLLPLSWKQIEERERKEILAFFEKNGVFPPRQGEDVRQLLAALDVSDHLKRLEKTEADLAYILGRMDVKLNLLLQLSYPKTKDRPLMPTRVSLGGGGLAFWGNFPEIAVGHFLEIRLALSVGTLAIVDFFVRVIEIDRPNSSELAKIACQFDTILDDVREQIIQHIFKRQTSMLRAKKRRMTQGK